MSTEQINSFEELLRKQEHSEGTIKTYRWHLENFLENFKNVPVQKISSEDIQRYLDNIQKTKKRAYFVQTRRVLKVFYKDILGGAINFPRQKPTEAVQVGAIQFREKTPSWSSWWGRFIQLF